MKNSNSKLFIKRGDIFTVNLGAPKTTLYKPVLVVQSNIGNRFAESIIVVPLVPASRFTRSNNLLSVIIKKGVARGMLEDYIAVFSQLRTLEKWRFERENYLGSINEETTKQVDKALEISLGLSALQRLEDRQLSQNLS